MEISVSVCVPFILPICPYMEISICVPFMPIYLSVSLLCPYTEISVGSRLGPCICPYAHIWRSLYQSVSLLCLYTEISVYTLSVSIFYAHMPMEISVSAHMPTCPYAHGDLCICPYAHIWSSQSYAHMEISVSAHMPMDISVSAHMPIYGVLSLMPIWRSHMPIYGVAVMSQ